MNDAKLIKFTKQFRRGILGRQRSEDMCFAICAPLAPLLEMNGVEVELKMGWVQLEGIGQKNHYWIALPDGRVLDPSGDQFNRFGGEMPPVYLGPPTWIHGAVGEG